jgi:cysteinyl-tRNA synthetase
MIALIAQLEQGKHTYETNEAVYFDTSTFDSYGALGGQKLEDKKQAAREDVNVDPQKKHPADFALWFKRVGRFADHSMHWESPWGDGFPGWHIECSAMAMQYLGKTLDIHTGGIDHIPVHHENEIAQSEAARGAPFVKCWVHHAFLMVDGVKMSKSLQNFYTIDDVEKEGIDPSAMRLLFLQTHYRQTMNFTWESARAANTSYLKLQDQVRSLRQQTSRVELSPEKLEQLEVFQSDFTAALENDLNTPQAVAVMWKMIKSNIPSPDKLDLLMEWDQVLGLSLATTPNLQQEAAPPHIHELAQTRQVAKKAQDWARADQIRHEIESAGYTITDKADSFILEKK